MLNTIGGFAFVAILIVLRFDGSLKRPSDPGLSTDSLGRVVAFGAIISIAANDDALQDQETVVWQDCQHVYPVPSYFTSARVEYMGLVLGLEGLAQYLENNTCGAQYRILVQGDCKTVLTHMSGRSRARKLADHKQRALAIIESFPARHPLQFQHVPRHWNSQCDDLCRQRLALVQSRAHDTCEDSLRKLKDGNGTASCADSLQDFVSQHLANQSSLIEISRRPELYARLAAVALQDNTTQSMELLFHIGRQLQNEAKKVWKQSSVDDLVERGTSLLLDGIAYEFYAATMRDYKTAVTKIKQRCRHCWLDVEQRISSLHEIHHRGKLD